MPGVAGSQPQNLAKPVAEAVPPAVAPMPRGTPAPAAQALQAAPTDDMESMYQQLAQNSAQKPADDMESMYQQLASQSQPQAPEPTEHADFMTRLKAGFAADDDQKEKYLKQQYGAGNVKRSGDKFEVKEDGKWKKFNNDWFGIGDPANLGRMAVVEAGALPAEVAAGTAAAGEALTIAGIPLAIPTAAAGRFAGGAMGEQTARMVGRAVGIPDKYDNFKDQAIDDALAMGTQGGMRAIFGHVLDRYTAHAATNGLLKGAATTASEFKNAVLKPAQETANETVERLAQPMMAKTTEALEKLRATDPLSAIAPEKRALAGVDDALALNEAAKKSGIGLRPDELFPNDPRLAELADKSLSSPKMQQFVLKRGQQAAEAVEQLGSSFKTAEGNATTAVQEGSVVDRAWGKLIGTFRDRAIEAAESPKRNLYLPGEDASGQMSLPDLPQRGNIGLGAAQGSVRQKAANTQKLVNAQQDFLDEGTKDLINTSAQQGEFTPGQARKVNMTNLAQKLTDLREMFGFEGTVPPGAKGQVDLTQALNLPNTGKTRYIVSQISKLTDKIANDNGEFGLREADMYYKMFKKLADTHYDPKAGQQSKAFYAFKELKDGFRDDFTNGIATMLGPEDRAAYQQAMGRFSEIKGASGKLKQLFDTDSPSVPAVVEYMRNGGIQNADRIQALKTVIQQDNPGAWDNISKAYFDRMIADHALEGAKGQRLGGVNWERLAKTLDVNKKQYSQLEAIVGPERATQLTDLTKVMAAAQRSDGEFKSQPGVAMRLIKAGGKLATLDVAGAADMFANNAAAVKLLNAPEAAKLIARMPLRERMALTKVLQQSVDKIAKRAPGIAAQQATSAIQNAETDQAQGQ